MSETLKLVNLHPNDWVTFFTVAFIILFASIALIKAFDWVRSRLGITTAAERRINKIEDNLNTLNEMILHDREETNIVREQMKNNFKKLNENVASLTESVATLQESVSKMESDAKERDQSKLSDAISRAYRYYKSKYMEDPSKAPWNEIEYETMMKWVKSYKDSGGNGWLEKYVIPDMKTWEVSKINFDDND